MTSKDRNEVAIKLLELIQSFLIRHEESNWIRGISAALSELKENNRATKAEKFNSAKSIYLTMIAGGGGFSEYYVADVDGVGNKKENTELSNLRKEIWILFQENR